MLELEGTLITTIITTYKRSELLERAVNSVLNQTYSNIELIVVDDNDDDTEYRRETSKIMSKYESDSRVNYIKHLKNMNGASARNTGIKNSNGTLITFLDDDDYFDTNRFKILIPKLLDSNKNIGAIFSGYRFLKRNVPSKNYKVDLGGDPLLELLKASFSIGSGSNFILKKSIIDSVGMFDINFARHQDFEFLVRVAEKYDFITEDKCLLTIQVDAAQQNKIDIDQLIKTKKQYLDKYNYIIDRYKKDEIIANHLRNIIYHIFVNNQILDYPNIFKQYFKYEKSLLKKIGLIKSFIGVKVLRVR